MNKLESVLIRKKVYIVHIGKVLCKFVWLSVCTDAWQNGHQQTSTEGQYSMGSFALQSVCVRYAVTVLSNAI